MTLVKSNLIFFKTLLFFLFDSLALSNVQYSSNNQLKLILIIRQDAIGDFVMWLDTAKEYRKLYPPDKYKIVLAGNKIWCDLAEELPYWDKVIPVDVKQFKTFSSYRWKLLRKIRKLKIETAIQPTFSREFYHGDVLVRASGALWKVSSAGDMANRNWLKQFIADSWHTELIPASTEPLTELERNAEFFSGLTDYPHLTNYPKLDIPEFWLSSEWKEKTFYILVPGTSGAVAGKEWPPAFFSDLATKVFRQTGWEGVICGAKQEHSLGEQILKQCDAPLQNFCGQTTLVELAGLLSQSRLTISNDTGTVFLSSAVGTLSVCILGGGHFGRFVPYPDVPGQTNHLKTIYHKMPCYGCNWVCIYPIIEGEPTPCIANISVGVVWSKVRPLLKNKTF
jgi:ADP-heptose:LPS heptosyltransferase